ncbi:hypothetical protein, partial [Myroides odoratimimus]
KIKDRLLNGFANWNKGYESWLKWCDTLYEPDAHYNTGTFHWTLQEYKDNMKSVFEGYDVLLGEFHNMLIIDDWCAIRYTVFITDKKTGVTIKQETMEFVHFKENPDPIGARVIEGWALSDTPIV